MTLTFIKKTAIVLGLSVVTAAATVAVAAPGASAAPPATGKVITAQVQSAGMSIEDFYSPNATVLTIVNDTQKLVSVQAQSYIDQNVKYKFTGAVLQPGDSFQTWGFNKKMNSLDVTGTLLFSDRTLVDFYAATPHSDYLKPFVGLGNYSTSVAGMAANNMATVTEGASKNLTAKDRSFTVTHTRSDVDLQIALELRIK